MGIDSPKIILTMRSGFFGLGCWFGGSTTLKNKMFFVFLAPFNFMCQETLHRVFSVYTQLDFLYLFFFFFFFFTVLHFLLFVYLILVCLISLGFTGQATVLVSLT